MVRLRGHHLICLHFFNGEGYDDAFKGNLRHVLERAGAEDIEVCEGADEICVKCPYLKNDICRYDEHADAEIKEMDEIALSFLKIDKGARVRWRKIKEDIPGIFPQWNSVNCSACDWQKVCEKNNLYKALKN